MCLFSLTLSIVLVTVTVYAVAWRNHTRERTVSARLAGDTAEYVGRHRADKDHPAMTWRL